jgi:hypothetical protein
MRYFADLFCAEWTLRPEHGSINFSFARYIKSGSKIAVDGTWVERKSNSSNSVDRDDDADT